MQADFGIRVELDSPYAEAVPLVTAALKAEGFGVLTEIDVQATLREKLGVERRLHTAGDKKAMLDPFGPEKPAEVKHLKDIQGDIHLAFKDMVRERRGKRLKAAEKDLFSGAFWTGTRALDMGLVDGLGDMRSVMRERYGENVKLRLIGGRRGLLRRLRFGGTDIDGDIAARAVSAVEERLIWNRFGL